MFREFRTKAKKKVNEHKNHRKMNYANCALTAQSSTP